VPEVSHHRDRVPFEPVGNASSRHYSSKY
jgi:hypothetical protein